MRPPRPSLGAGSKSTKSRPPDPSHEDWQPVSAGGPPSTRLRRSRTDLVVSAAFRPGSNANSNDAGAVPPPPPPPPPLTLSTSSSSSAGKSPGGRSVDRSMPRLIGTCTHTKTCHGGRAFYHPNSATTVRDPNGSTKGGPESEPAFGVVKAVAVAAAPDRGAARSTSTVS
jgi:hypothetical protein